MTDKTEAQPEALRLADARAFSIGDDLYAWEHSAEQMIRDQNAKIQQLKAQITTQTNRAASAEQQVTTLTQRLDMANRLNTDAREQLAQLSARQAAPDGWRLVPELPTLNMLNTAFGICTENGLPVQQMIEAAAGKYAAMLSAAPPAPEREPLNINVVSSLMPGIGDRDGWDLDDMYSFARAIERAHGIGATND